MLRKNLSITFLIVVCTGLGIGANSAIFSVVNATLLKPLPYKDPDRIVVLQSKTGPKNETSVSYPDFLDWKDQNNTLEHMAVLQANSFNLTGSEEPTRIVGLLVSADLFPLLGRRHSLGAALVRKKTGLAARA